MTSGPLCLTAAQSAGVAQPKPAAVVFEDVTNHGGIRFRHLNGASPEKYMPETMGSGGLLFDYDGDGWLDVFLVDGGSLADPQLARQARHTLYRNGGDGTFRDVTSQSGITHRAYGMGACAADYDNDGWPDLYVTSFGANVLYRNRGDGTFADVTEKARVATSSWSASCAFADFDKDGDLDLFVTNYVDFGLDNNKFCGDRGNSVRSYCHPNVYNGLPSVLYRNDGDGRFTDVTREAGLYTTRGKALGVVFGDYDDDGWPDLYVANDSVPNFLYRNLGNDSFTEVGLYSGAAVASDGLPRAGMGTDFADYDGDGRLDLVVTNLDMQSHTLYRNFGRGLFEETTFASGIGEATMPFVGFGVAFLDYDNDGDLDLAIANGNVLDNASLLRQGATLPPTQPAVPQRRRGPLQGDRARCRRRSAAREGQPRAGAGRRRQRRRPGSAGHQQW